MQHLFVSHMSLDLCLQLVATLQVIVTQRAGQAFDVMASISDKELNSYDGVIAVVSHEIPYHAFFPVLLSFIKHV